MPTQFIFQHSGAHDITTVPPDQRKTITSSAALEFIMQPENLSLGKWTVTIADRTVEVLAISGTFETSLADNAIFTDRRNEWLDFLKDDLVDFVLNLDELDDTEHEIKVTNGVIDFQFKVDQGTLSEGTFEGGVFSVERPTDITMNWSEFLLWQIFLDEIQNIAIGDQS